MEKGENSFWITGEWTEKLEKVLHIITDKSGLLTNFSNILFTLLRISRMAASVASGDPFRRGSASVIYLFC